MSDRIVRNRKRIMHVTECFVGGTRSAILAYVSATPQYEHLLLATSGRSANDLVVPDAVFTTVMPLPSGHGARIRAVRDAARVWRPDIVHAHSSFAGAYVRLALRDGHDLGIVYTPHAYAFERRDIGAVKTAALHAIESVLSPNTSVVAACSAREASLARRMRAREVVYVPNVADAEFLSVPHGGAGGSRIAVLGRVAPQRDPAFVCAVADHLHRIHPGATVEWLGNGDPSLELLLVAHGIEVTGWLDAAEIRNHLRACAVYLHPGRWEGFPIALLEAHGLGMPVIARDAEYLDGAPDDVRYADPGKMAEAIGRLLADGVARARNVESWDDYLAGNNPAAQREALEMVYGSVLRQRRLEPEVRRG